MLTLDRSFSVEMGRMNSHTGVLSRSHRHRSSSRQKPPDVKFQPSKSLHDIASGMVLAPDRAPDLFRHLWKLIWGVKVPGKVAIHAWKCCASVLPTRAALSRKGYNGEMGCLLCSSQHEDTVHIFANCPYAQQVWGAANIVFGGPGVGEFRDLLLALATTQSKEQFAKTPVVLWSIWKNRNSQLWENKQQWPSEAALLSLGWLQEFQKASGMERQRSNGQSHRWSKPAPGWVKCNTDGAYTASTRAAAFGVVLREESGSFVAVAAAPLRQMTSPFYTELMALVEGMKFAETLRHEKVIFETDCLLLVQALAREEADLCSVVLLLDEVKEFLRRKVEFKVLYTPRETILSVGNVDKEITVRVAYLCLLFLQKGEHVIFGLKHDVTNIYWVFLILYGLIFSSILQLIL